jgi:valyl-tRNA synthetase
MDKRYDFKQYETKIYKQEQSYFKPSGKGEPYCIMMPPPNITGVLHVGHALTFTLQDILIRYYRMQGCDVLWQPGTDHAGIATQMVVERQLNAQGIKRTDLSREAFIQKCFEWKDVSQAHIMAQQKRLGISPDWDRSRFTMDPGLSKAVVKVFKQLFDEGIIYRDKRLVNWDFAMNTALSDLEVVQKEAHGKYYHLRYDVKGGGEIVVATTRPETLFGDTAIAVNPKDERYQHLIGKIAIVPLCLREVPIVADDYCDPEKGTGAVKITPAHDFNDYEVGKRHNLPMLNILDNDGCLNKYVPSGFQNIPIADARKIVVAALGDALIKVEEIKHTVPVNEKNGDRVEPLLTDQWYVNASVLAVPALKAVSTGELNFIPEQWVNTYKRWLEDIQPWCISRQLWWGHRIPIWYGPDGQIFCAETEGEAQKQAGNLPLHQETDVLDTWFSSALWPFSTLGWLEETPDLERYFPTSVLVTGFDIIFFWVARMVMMSYYLFGKSPFQDVYIHALVRDAQGQKMSKTKGNVLDPLVVIDQYGADALRLALCALSVPGRDIALGDKVVEGYSHFVTKLWNAGRFLEARSSQQVGDVSHACHDWMAACINEAILTINKHFVDYRFDLYVKALYKLVWGQFCDIYLEALKSLADEESTLKARQFFVIILKLCHPVMPFITEALAAQFGSDLLISAVWPKPLALDTNEQAKFQMVLDLCQTIKFIKSTLDIKEKITIAYTGVHQDIVMGHHTYIQQTCGVIFGAATGLTMGDLVFDCGQVDAGNIALKRKKLEQDQTQCQKLLANERFKTEKPEVYAEKIELGQMLSEQLAVLKLIENDRV